MYNCMSREYTQFFTYVTLKSRASQTCAVGGCSNYFEITLLDCKYLHTWLGTYRVATLDDFLYFQYLSRNNNIY